MNRWIELIIAMVLGTVFAMGCSGDGSPLTLDINQEMTTGTAGHTEQTHSHLWGYYDIVINIENQTVEAFLNRDVMFTANVVSFLNSNPVSMTFVINDTPVGTGYIDVDIDVGLTHPLPGMPQYHGYDVRGVFMGNGSGTMAYNTDLEYSVFGPDQFMFPDPDGGNGAPDGYTRWYNNSEFNGGMTLLSYTQGNMATPGFDGNATLCPYKYFADGLGTNDDLWTWLNEHADQNGIFSSGATNTRNYYLRFPTPDPNVKYGYAVIANWEGEDVHPSNAVEAPGINAAVTPDIYWVDAGDNGGDLILDIDVFGWEYQPSTIFIESTVFSGAQEFPSPLTATGGDENYSTYHVEIPSTSVTSTLGNEFWVICQYDGFTYGNEFGVPNDAETDFLAAFFREDLYVSNTPYEYPSLNYTFAGAKYYDGIGPDGTANNPMPTEWDIDFDASYYTGATSFEWDIDGNGTYESGILAIPTYTADYPIGTTPGTYYPIVRIDGAETYQCAVGIVVRTGIFVDLANGSAGGTGAMGDPFDTINNGIAGATSPADSIIMIRGDNGTSVQQVYNERIDLVSTHAGIHLQGYSVDAANSEPPAWRDFTPSYRELNSHFYQECIYGVDVDGVKIDGFEFETIWGLDGPEEHPYMIVYPIYFVDSDNVIISHIYMHHMLDNGQSYPNNISWKPGRGICLENCDNAVVTNYLFYYAEIGYDYCSVYAFFANAGSDNLLAANCTIDDIGQVLDNTRTAIGFYIYDSDSPQLINIIVTSLIGMYADAPRGIAFHGSNITGTPLVDYNDAWDIYNVRFSGDFTEGANCLDTDPLFVNGHHLNTGSLCIDAGDPTILDYDGGPSDMGCYGGPGGDWNFEN